MTRWLGVLLSAITVACHAPPASTPRGASARRFAPPNADPTVIGARLVPLWLDLKGSMTAPDGAVLGVTAGVRFRVGTDGSVSTADTDIDQGSRVVGLPLRLGGGFLFVRGDTVLRSADWLSEPRPLFRSSRGVDDVFAGLDRLYARTKRHSHAAFDPKTGAAVDLGAWPADPAIGSYVALDGWRALAVADVRGLVGTTDAGRTWTPIALAVQLPRVALVRRDGAMDEWAAVSPLEAGDAYLVTEADTPLATAARRADCHIVSATLEVLATVDCSRVRSAVAHPASFVESSTLRSALVDGWPLSDGSALVADRGDVTRVSLADGRVLETLPNAFDPELGACHAVPARRAGREPGVGFVCTAADGGTALLRLDPQAGSIETVRRFRSRRIVRVSSGGAWIVDGSCGGPESPKPPVTYCLGEPIGGRVGYRWRDVPAHGPGAIATVTADGALVEIAGDVGLADARMTITSGSGVTHAVPVRLADATTLSTRLLARGLLLADFEERRPGVLGGWLATEGAMVGFEIDESGELRLGALVRAMGSPFVSGRYGLGWTASRQAYETTDGGMTWVQFVGPPPIAESTVRACGPAGCVANGWLRVGWGDRVADPAPVPDAAPLLRRAPQPSLHLVCRPPASARPSAEPPSRRAGPREAVIRADLLEAFEPRPARVGWVEAWGPRSGRWGEQGRSAAVWQSPGAAVERSTLAERAPFADADDAAAALGIGRGAPITFTIARSDDGAHALLVARSLGRPPEVDKLEDRGERVPLVRTDGRPWGSVDAAVRVGADWFLASVTADRHAIEILKTDGGRARTVAVVQRHVVTPITSAPRLARATGRGAIGVVLDGEAAYDRAGTTRWVVPIDVASGEVRAPELLGGPGLPDTPRITVCADTGAGWELDTAWSEASVTLALGEGGPRTLAQVRARFRVGATRVCVERLAAADIRGTRWSPEPTPTDPSYPLAVELRDASSDSRVMLACAQATK